MGTPSYVSPERWLGASPTVQSDIWSLGVLFYESLTGRLPFVRREGTPIGSVVLNEAPLPVSSIMRDVPETIDRIIGRALAKETTGRYPSMEPMLADLRAARRGAETSSEAPTMAIAATTGAEARRAETSPSTRGSLSDSGSTSRAIDSSSIAVLPFLNMGGDEESDYFTEGIAEELISALTKIPSLRVVARTSSFQFRGAGVDIPEAGRRLKVGKVLCGSVRRSGDRLRVGAELVNATDGFVLWSEVFQRRSKDLFEIEEEITEAIIATLRLRLGTAPPGEAARRDALRKDPANVEAHNLYLQGRYHLNRRSEAELQRAIGFFEQSIEQDDGAAGTHASLATARMLMGVYGWRAPGDSMPSAMAAGKRAAELDPSLPDPHIAFALNDALYEWNWPQAEARFRTVLDLAPGYSLGHLWYGFSLVNAGRFAEAMTEMRRAEDLDPLSMPVKGNLGWIRILQRRYPDAIHHLQKYLELEPNYARLNYYLSIAYSETGEFERAVESVRAAANAGSPPEIAQMGRTFALWGKTDEAVAAVRHLEEIARARYVSPVEFCYIYAALGNQDQAFAYLEKAEQERATFLIFANVDPRMDRLRPDARYRQLLRKLGWE
jgi:TolB-like protein/Flp pilus assembly protein TadD